MLKNKSFAAIFIVIISIASSQVMAQSMNQLWNLCYNQNNQKACDAWEDSIHRKMDGILAPIDPPRLRQLTLQCRKGDNHACNAEIAWRRSITRGYQNGINTMNREYGSSWIESFGLGGY